MFVRPKRFGENISSLCICWHVVDRDQIVSKVVTDGMITNVDVFSFAIIRWIFGNIESRLVIGKDGN